MENYINSFPLHFHYYYFLWGASPDNINPSDTIKRCCKVNYNGIEKLHIGEIALTEIHDKSLLNVVIQDESLEFIIDDTYRIYPIVNHIFTKCNYS